MRPSDFTPRFSKTEASFCPFCPGSEDATPPELLALRAPDAPADVGRWTVRAFPNRFPALRVEGELERTAEGPYDRVSGIGAHEVIVETVRHDETLADLGLPALGEVLWAWRERILDLGRDLRLAHVQIFKNHGPEAGATILHEHSQVIALPVVPRDVALEREEQQAWFGRKERCLTCDIVRHERRDGERLVFENARYAVLCPWAPLSPFVLWIVPKGHSSHFEAIERHELESLAEALRLALRKLDKALERPAYNFALHSGPLRGAASPSLHWRLEVAPTLTVPGGFERGTGSWLNSTPPEEAAAFLRKVRE
ncbi:Galactose-1-phosphate uridylyltransferase [Vulgatibacter incomptus]|uniref:Galactose-1-phosphate uridylyltransferase n=1 Tax=Vulgatibacter incomptus TaxID=1391653 RepID=A0A0K1P955_9BACT|nr:Galactose-1-phosphate uridylyltransferase [Vulgatibacter incomptus]